VTNRLTMATYLNFSQSGGEAMVFEAPSLEFVYALGEPGRHSLNPALYLETTESGEELELEPKLLLGHRHGRLVSALNLIGEFEFRHNDDELLEDGSVMRRAWAWEIAGGTAYEIGPRVSLGLEGRYAAEYPNFGPKTASALFLGPSINLQAGKAQLALGLQRQMHGSPKTSGSLNREDFERTSVRAIIGVQL